MFGCMFLYSSDKWISACKTNARKPCMLQGTITTFKKMFRIALFEQFEIDKLFTETNAVRRSNKVHFITTTYCCAYNRMGSCCYLIQNRQNKERRVLDSFWTLTGYRVSDQLRRHYISISSATLGMFKLKRFNPNHKINVRG